MKELLKKAYSNNYIFYSLGAFTSFFLFFFTFKSFNDFMSRQFVEAFSFFIFMSFMTVMILELKSAFFGGKEEALELVEAEEEEVGVEVEERAELSDSGEKNISNPESREVVYEWDEVEEKEIEETSDSNKSKEEEEQKKEEVKAKIQKKKITAKLEEEDNTPPEAAGFVPEADNDPFS